MNVQLESDALPPAPTPRVQVLTDSETKKGLYLMVEYRGRYAYIALDENEEIPLPGDRPQGEDGVR